VDFNPFLRQPGDAKAGPDAIEDPATAHNLRWQTRPAQLTDHERSLARALTEIFARDIWELPAVARELNQADLPPPEGGQWTETGLAAELARLAG
jgi:hypothetical protein